MADTKRIADLIVKEYTQILNNEEANELNDWGEASIENKNLLIRLRDKAQLRNKLKDYYSIRVEAGLLKVPKYNYKSQFAKVLTFVKRFIKF